MAQSSSNGIAICISGFMDDVIFSYHEETGTVLCGLLCGSAGWHSLWPVWVAAAHWLSGLAGRFAGVALAVWQLDLAAAGDGDEHFAICFMLVVSCTSGQSLICVIALFHIIM